jgi:hypothetical protein
MARPRSNSIDVRNQKEIPISILQWLGMKSNFPPESIPVNSLSYVLNCDYTSENEITTRKGCTEWMSDAVTGNVAIVNAIEFHRKGQANSELIFATSNGKLYRGSTTTADTAPTLIGNLTTSVTLENVYFAVMKSKLYIADGTDAWVYDGTTLAAVGLPADVLTQKIIDVLKQNSRLWWLTDGDEVIASGVNDPTDYTVDVWRNTINEEDGMTCSKLTKWGRAIVITKQNRLTKQLAMYKVTGYNVDTFRVDEMYGDQYDPVGYIGASAIALGDDVIGLTPNGFNSIQAIDTFKETKMNSLSRDIDDFIRRINHEYSYKSSAIFDKDTRQYMCSVPIDSANYNNIILIYHPETQRWGLYDNWDVRCFFYIGGTVYYGTEHGKIIKTRDGENDLGAGFDKIVETPDWHFDSPETIKLFKQVDLKLTQAGKYDINFTPVVDGNDFLATPIALTIQGTANWDVFNWDVDRWDAPVNTNRTVLPMMRGKTLRVRISNSNADEPFSLRGMTPRSYITDAGAAA